MLPWHELVIGHIFYHAGLYTALMFHEKGEWNKPVQSVEVCGKTLGIIGFGRNRQDRQKKAKALGMKVKFYDITGPIVEISYISIAARRNYLLFGFIFTSYTFLTAVKKQ